MHGKAHAEPRPHPVAVLGYTTWPRDLRVSPFLHQINEYGLQFGYGLIRDPEQVPFNFFYTSNVSLPRELLLEAGLFDTSFPHAAWEDIEVAYRLMQRGMRMLYRPEAVARHHHDITFASFRRRQEKAGEAAAIFYRKHPELGDFLAVPQAKLLPERRTLAERFLPVLGGAGGAWSASRGTAGARARAPRRLPARPQARPRGGGNRRDILRGMTP